MKPTAQNEDPNSNANEDPNDFEYEDREWCNACSNQGYIICHCGGDLCVCENQGEYPCPACS
jgi:hypothetical protein